MQRRASPGPMPPPAAPVIHEDPLLIAQTLTYVTDDGSVQQTYSSTGFSVGSKIAILVLECVFVTICIVAVPVGAHGTAVSVTIGNMAAVAWFWYNYVRSVELSAEGGLRFWIGNQEIFVPFDRIASLRRTSSPIGFISPSLFPHKGFLTSASDGVAIVTTMVSEPFFLWPRSAGKPERKFLCCTCPKLTLVFSPTGGSLSFIREVENEMRHYGSNSGADTSRFNQGRVVPPSHPPQQKGAPILWLDRDNPNGTVSTGTMNNNGVQAINANGASLDLFDV